MVLLLEKQLFTSLSVQLGLPGANNNSRTVYTVLRAKATLILDEAGKTPFAAREASA